MNSIKTYQQWIEQEIKKNKYGKNPVTLYEPIRYLMAIGGKRLRPILVLLSYSLYKDDTKSIVPYATAVELFHNFTLMHDDIMDNAPVAQRQCNGARKMECEHRYPFRRCDAGKSVRHVAAAAR
jgi:geranylgeranyl diphosphate synthase type II